MTIKIKKNKIKIYNNQSFIELINERGEYKVNDINIDEVDAPSINEVLKTLNILNVIVGFDNNDDIDKINNIYQHTKKLGIDLFLFHQYEKYLFEGSIKLILYIAYNYIYTIVPVDNLIEFVKKYSYNIEKNKNKLYEMKNFLEWKNRKITKDEESDYFVTFNEVELKLIEQKNIKDVIAEFSVFLEKDKNTEIKKEFKKCVEIFLQNCRAEYFELPTQFATRGSTNYDNLSDAIHTHRQQTHIEYQDKISIEYDEVKKIVGLIYQSCGCTTISFLITKKDFRFIFERGQRSHEWNDGIDCIYFAYSSKSNKWFMNRFDEPVHDDDFVEYIRQL
jgi:hypothetical protein